MDRFMFFRERKRLAEEYEKWVNQPLEDGSKIKDCPFSVISFMASKGFVKINDNEIVISKEELEKGVIEREWMRKGIDEILNDNLKLQEEFLQARKETAEKIYTFVNSFGTNNWERFKGFIKQFGVDLGERACCDCYHLIERIIGWETSSKPRTKIVSECWGTKNREQCKCEGDTTKCDFYPKKRGESKPEDDVGDWYE